MWQYSSESQVDNWLLYDSCNFDEKYLLVIILNVLD